MKINRHAFAVIFGFALLFSLTVGSGLVKAEATFPVLMGPIHIESPTNRTYTSGFLTLNVGFGGLCFNSIQHSLTYSLDGKDMGALAVVPHYPAYLSVQASFTASVQLPQLSKGQHVVTVYAEHSAYNIYVNGVIHQKITQQDNATVIFNISDTIPINELTPPAITNFTAENKTYRSVNLTFSFNVDKAVVSTGYCLDNATIPLTDWWNTPTSARTFNLTLRGLAEGSHGLMAYAEDTFGNIGASDCVNFYVDTTSPKVSILSVKNKTYDLTYIPLNFVVDESVYPIEYNLDGEENVSTLGNCTLNNLTNGVHNVTVYVWDGAGNMGASETITFTVDAPIPVVAMAAVSAISIVAVACVGLLFHFKKHK